MRSVKVEMSMRTRSLVSIKAAATPWGFNTLGVIILYDEDEGDHEDDDIDDCHLRGVSGRGDFPLFVAAPPHQHLSPILA